MPKRINSDYRCRRKACKDAFYLISLSSVFGLFIASPVMSAQPQKNQDSACSVQIIRTPADNLYQYQLHLECPDTGETVHYSLEVSKQGKNGTSRNRQSGRIKLEHPHLMIGNLRINSGEQDEVVVKGEIQDLQHNVIAKVTRYFPDRPEKDNAAPG
ncbi:hypothetical protein MWU49_05075 [Alcanivorax sp. S6407]|uniref:hypothetical protein n=1 Tax=Alcanivorax sp. S6407 TaxID=2926424 RepID=UPI001FF1396F|nr:hypothetical protein [Alcanivorax sp. S6407]MCK0153065.1 hypothetical protein [Alcanivorax sp. S6407]